MAELFSFLMTGKAKTDANAGSAWSDQYLVLFGFPTFLWMLGNLIHLLRSRDFNTYPQHNTRLNNHLRIDAWLALLLALILLAFPRQLLKLILPGTTSNEVMLHFMRCKGAMLVGEAITSLQAPGFLHSRDKLALFTSHIVLGVLAGVVYAVAVFLFNIVGSLFYHGPIIAVLFINALTARFTDGTTIYVVQTPSKPKDKPAVQTGAGETSAGEQSPAAGEKPAAAGRKSDKAKGE